MLSSVEQAFVGRDEERAPLETPAWEAKGLPEVVKTAECRFNSHNLAAWMTKLSWIEV